MEKVWTMLLLLAAAASAVAWLVALMRESGVRPVRGLAALIMAQPRAGRILVGAAFASAWIVAGAKPGGMRSGDGISHGDTKARRESGDGVNGADLSEGVQRESLRGSVPPMRTKVNRRNRFGDFRFPRAEA